eukprot:4633395-Prymnesium_polylepis.1
MKHAISTRSTANRTSVPQYVGTRMTRQMVRAKTWGWKGTIGLYAMTMVARALLLRALNN